VESCGSCPLLSSGKFDLSRFNLLLKKKSFENYPITIVSPSKWLASKVKASKVLKGNRIEIIPNGTDLNTFKPMDKKLAREILNLEDRGRFILFGAMGGTTDSRKGFKLLQEALKILRESYDYSDIKLLIFGSSKPKYDLDLSFSAHYFGKIHDDTYLSILYSAADATITPSTQEAFGMVASESMACGTPVISFGATGSLDVIDHKINGYLAKPFEAEDLANGITWVLSNESRLKSLSRLSRLKCEKDFNIYDVSKKYQALYLDIIKNNS
jgi:glycosyltransferase involved in cell wall biosynthesis